MNVLSILLSILLFSFAPATSQVEPADLVFVNGNIYTGNDRNPQAAAIAIKGDRIIFVGSAAAARKYMGAKTRTIDLQGRTVVPGLTDAHYHFLGVGQREMNLNLEASPTCKIFSPG